MARGHQTLDQAMLMRHQVHHHGIGMTAASRGGLQTNIAGLVDPHIAPIHPHLSLSGDLNLPIDLFGPTGQISRKHLQRHRRLHPLIGLIVHHY